MSRVPSGSSTASGSTEYTAGSSASGDIHPSLLIADEIEAGKYWPEDEEGLQQLYDELYSVDKVPTKYNFNSGREAKDFLAGSRARLSAFTARVPHVSHLIRTQQTNKILTAYINQEARFLQIYGQATEQARAVEVAARAAATSAGSA